MLLVYQFDWDPNKARINLKKHRVSFLLAMSVFHDPLSITIFDEAHSENEERWVTVGKAENGQTLVIVHTFQLISAKEAKLRIITARKADKQERLDYEGSPR